MAPTDAAPSPASGTLAVIDRDGLDMLIKRLGGDGYRVVGPRLRDQAIIYDDIAGVDDLPAGWTDTDQDGGHYRVKKRDDDALFGYVVGPRSWKTFLHEPRLSVWKASRHDGQTHVIHAPEPAKPLALIGVRSCDLHAIAIQDRVLMGGAYVDPHYRARREGVFIVAINCGEAGGTCFCVSMETGPRADSGFDLSLTEIGADEFLIEVGSRRGEETLASVPHDAAGQGHIDAATAATAHATEHMGRHMAMEGLPALLKANLEHPRWEEVAGRCLTCANCTMVCPTCFCTSVEDSSDLTGTEAERSRRWDSCFTMDYSYVHGGSVRASAKSRYRQWMTHKLATWWDQFDTSGCVGCGRCITWCPVGIDITEEVSAIRETPMAGAS